MVPIYEGEEMIGLFEVVVKFNSIAEKIAAQGIVPVFLADKRYYDLNWRFKKRI